MKDDSIILIYRESIYVKYYLFPGGVQEDFETKEECIIKECKEELGIVIKISIQLYEVKGEGTCQNLFLCKWVSGELGTCDEEKYDLNMPTGLQFSMLIKVIDLKNLNIISPDILDEFLKDYDKYEKVMCGMVKLINEQ